MLNCPRCNLRLDYVPKERKESKKPGPVRDLVEGEFHRCDAVTGDDCQSGPIYCGERAVCISADEDDPRVICTACATHRERLEAYVRKQNPERVVYPGEARS